MATFKEKVIALLNKVYRQDIFTNDYINAIAKEIGTVDDMLNAIKNDFFFDTLEINGVHWWEKLLDIYPDETKAIEDRRSAIQAKWQSNNHNSILLIQQICNAWKNGDVEADFVNGKIQLTFVGEYGIPADLAGLLNAVNQIKPAHLAYVLIYRYLLKKEIHLILTKSEMETYLKNQYCEVGV